MLHHLLGAVVAVHRAAPVEFAVAAAHHLCAPLLHLQAALVAQPATAAPLARGQCLSVLHALPALGAMQPQAAVPAAVVRGVLQVDQLRLLDPAQRVHDGPAAVRAVARAYALLVDVQLLRLAVFELQVVANFSEVRQLGPAGLHAATLGHAVAPADALHGRSHGLWEPGKARYSFLMWPGSVENMHFDADSDSPGVRQRCCAG